MKKIKLIDGELGPGFKKLLGGKVFLFCANYFYTGKLIGWSDVEVCLVDCEIVFETGDFAVAGWEDAQRIGFSNEHYVRIPAIESYSKLDIIL